MSLAIIYSRAAFGMDAPLITVEVHLSFGTVGLNMVGLPETAVKESKDRVRSAIINSHFEFPIQKITINLAPADLPKLGSSFDLPIALGILAASKQIPNTELDTYEFSGELALSGELRPIHGVLPAAIKVKAAKRKYIVPMQNSAEAALVKDVQVYGAKHLLDVCAHLSERKFLSQCEMVDTNFISHKLDMCDVKGQPHAKRAITIAAAGKHSLLFVGPPGTGKTMLASRLPTILPPLNEKEALESAAITSFSNQGFDANKWKQIPFRAPHHTSSSIALVGGGRPPRPGEISLAHHGVLFLDELPEFHRHVLESLREPLESGSITISRASYQALYPAQFQLLAAMNPCPCGHAGNPEQICRCSSEKIKAYFAKLSGPLLDRIDMQIEVAMMAPEELAKKNHDELTSKQLLKIVIAARNSQWQRQTKYNAHLSPNEIEKYCVLEPAASTLLMNVMSKLKWSARVYHRIIKLARTIADIENNEIINQQHVAEAITYRCLDRNKLIN